MDERRFQQVDVFSAEALRGNPVAVVVDGDGLTDEAMAALARWTDLSETTFLLAPRDPGADYRLRIFTPGGELPFAGHPTLGSAHAWLAAGGTPADPATIVQECAAGLVRLRRRSGRLAFAAPACRRTPVDEALEALVVDALGLDEDQVAASRHLDNGVPWLVLRLADAAALDAIEPDLGLLADIAEAREVGVVAPHPTGADVALELRAFAPALGIDEDPVTGSLHAAVARWLVDEGAVTPPYVAAQGAHLGRSGRVHVDADGSDLWVGGATRTVVAGTIDL